MILSLAYADVISHDEIDREIENNEEVSEIQFAVFNMWFKNAILNYDSNKNLQDKTLSLKEISFIKNNNIEKSVDCCYALLEKYTLMTFDELISCVLKALNYLSDMKIPKEYAGGFLILLCKYHFLP